MGRPSVKPKIVYESFRYQAHSWTKARRVVAKVEWHAGELFPRIGFIVTKLTWQAKRVVRFYNQRGTAEQWIKEGKLAGPVTLIATIEDPAVIVKILDHLDLTPLTDKEISTIRLFR